MAAIGRIGSAGAVDRDSQSAGRDAVDTKVRRDLNNLGQTNQNENVKQPCNAKVNEVAKLYEKQFLGEMVKAMRSTVSFSDASKPSMGENIYRDQLDGEYVESWGENGGIGLSEMIYTQIMNRYFDGGAKEFQKKGPIQLSDRDVSGVSRIAQAPGTSSKAGGTRQVPLRIELKAQSDGSAAKIKAPWDAEVVSKTRLQDQSGEVNAVTLDHGSGVRSTLIFKGVASAEIEPGRQVAKNGTIGVLSHEKNSFLWNLNAPKSIPAKGPETKE